MTTAGMEAGRVSAAAAPGRGVSALGGRLAAVCVSHAAVDFFSAIIIPLLSVLEGRLSMTREQTAVLVGLGSLSSGAIQPVVAWLGDRYDTRLLGSLGALVAVVAIGSVGFASTFEQIMLIQLVGAAGIGAFHPASAAAMGQLSGRRRSLGVSVFFTAGMVGGIAGSYFSPNFVKAYGLPALAWTIGPGLLGVAVLVWAIHSIPHRAAAARADHSALPARERRWRWAAVGILYTGNALRFTVNMALVQLIKPWTEALALGHSGAPGLSEAVRTRASTLNGPMQAAMMIGMGVSGLAVGLLRPRHEKAILILLPAAGAAAIYALPRVGGGAPAYLLAIGAGVGFAGVIPLTISLAQRLLPHRTGLASGLMMGGAWMLAAAGPLLSERLVGSLGLAGAFAVVAGLLLAAGLVSLALPGWLLDKTPR